MKIIDLFKGYDKLYNSNNPANKQLDVWLDFMNIDSFVKNLCINDYQDNGYNYQKIAIENVFTYSPEDFNRMMKTRDLLIDIIQKNTISLSRFYNVESNDLKIIIYHGLGNAAGMMDLYHNKLALYFGVEKIVELNWDNKQKLEDLFAHEYAHLIHQQIRNESLEPFTNFKQKYLFKLYTEGVATYCEKTINGRIISMPAWYQKGLNQETILKRKFLTMLENRNPSIHHYFGDWYQVLDMIEAGYFLGMRFIEKLHKTTSIKEIMKMDYKKIEEEIIKFLQ